MQPAATLTVVQQDAMAVAASDLDTEPTHLVANLPYNISVPVLLHLLATFPSIERSLVMVQAEVGTRLAAGPGSKVYGSPSVKAACVRLVEHGRARQPTGVLARPERRQCARGVRPARAPGDERLRSRVFTLVDAAFQQRRKMPRQSLSGVLGGSAHASEVLTAGGHRPDGAGRGDRGRRLRAARSDGPGCCGVARLPPRIGEIRNVRCRPFGASYG
ncbi:rRNA adenine N-6-methyltransferase family protein [Sphingomonas sp. LR61]|uniref:ribosomal RNA small subunit methyltransferase A n=1 Tax=Sphingomonas sp. LR61 TaxID=3050234 RepID=UPI002FE3B51F